MAGYPRTCEKHKSFTAKTPQAWGKHWREQHPGEAKPGGTKAPPKKKLALEVPSHLKGTDIGEALALILEQRKTNADEVARCDKAIDGILAHAPGE